MATGTYKNNKGGYTVRTYWSSKMDIAGNFSTVTCDHYLDCDPSWDLYIGTRTGTSNVGGDSKEFTVTKISQDTSGGSHKLGTTTHKVSHDADGKKSVTATTTFPINATIGSTWYGDITATGYLTLDDIPRFSSITVDNGTLGVAQNFKVTRNDDSFSHAITFSCGTVTNSSAVAKTTNLTPSWTPPLSLASQNTSGNKVTVTFTITTYNSAGTAIGTNTASAEYTIPSTVVPTCNATVTDGKGYLATYGGYIQGMSTFKVTVSGTPIYGSPIKSYRTIANGTPYYTSTFETAVIKDAGSQTIEASVTDDRGNTGTKNVSVTVLEYKPPSVEASVTRCNENYEDDIEGKYIKVSYKFTIYNLNNKNLYKIKIKYTRAGDTGYTTSEWTPSEPFASGSITTMEMLEYLTEDIDPDASYDIEVSVTDKFNTSAQSLKVGSVFTFLHFDGPTKDGYGKNKLNVIDQPELVLGADEGLFGIMFFDEALQLSYEGDYEYLPCVFYSITDIKKGDVIRFNSVLLDPDCFVYAYLETTNTTSEGYIETIEVASLSYIDGQTISSFEFTIPDKVTSLQMSFYVNNDDTSTRTWAKYKRPILTINEDDMTYERYTKAVAPSLGIGKIAELQNGADFGLKARFNEGFEYPIIRQYTDLNTLLTPNFYIGENVAEYQYINCPITGGTFYLEIVGAGVNRVRQTITTCSKENSVSYERFYYDGSWGEWRNCYHGQEVLYDNSSGSAGTISLLKDVTNFAFVDIYYKANNEYYGGHTRIPAINGKNILLHIVEPGASYTWIRRTAYTLSTRALTPFTTGSSGLIRLGASGITQDVAGNYIMITKIMGIRK